MTSPFIPLLEGGDAQEFGNILQACFFGGGINEMGILLAWRGNKS